MKIFLIIAGAMLAVGLAGLGMALLLDNGTPPPQTAVSPPSALPSATSSVVATVVYNKTIPDQLASAGTEPAIAQSFLGQIQNPDLIQLQGTAVASDYALQIWEDENKGGEALLRYDPSLGWTLVSLGGGEWSSSALVALGVPPTTAEQLVAASKE